MPKILQHHVPARGQTRVLAMMDEPGVIDPDAIELDVADAGHRSTASDFNKETAETMAYNGVDYPVVTVGGVRGIMLPTDEHGEMPSSFVPVETSGWSQDIEIAGAYEDAGFSKGDRVIVNFDTARDPSFYLGTVTKVSPKTKMVYVKFDDQDVGAFTPDNRLTGILGFQKGARRRSQELSLEQVGQALDTKRWVAKALTDALAALTPGSVAPAPKDKAAEVKAPRTAPANPQVGAKLSPKQVRAAIATEERLDQVVEDRLGGAIGPELKPVFDTLNKIGVRVVKALDNARANGAPTAKEAALLEQYIGLVAQYETLVGAAVKALSAKPAVKVNETLKQALDLLGPQSKTEADDPVKALALQLGAPKRATVTPMGTKWGAKGERGRTIVHEVILKLYALGFAETNWQGLPLQPGESMRSNGGATWMHKDRMVQVNTFMSLGNGESTVNVAASSRNRQDPVAKTPDAPVSAPKAPPKAVLTLKIMKELNTKFGELTDQAYQELTNDGLSVVHPLKMEAMKAQQDTIRFVRSHKPEEFDQVAAQRYALAVTNYHEAILNQIKAQGGATKLTVGLKQLMKSLSIPAGKTTDVEEHTGRIYWNKRGGTAQVGMAMIKKVRDQLRAQGFVQFNRPNNEGYDPTGNTSSSNDQWFRQTDGVTVTLYEFLGGTSASNSFSITAKVPKAPNGDYSLLGEDVSPMGNRGIKQLKVLNTTPDNLTVESLSRSIGLPYEDMTVEGATATYRKTGANVSQAMKVMSLAAQALQAQGFTGTAVSPKDKGAFGMGPDIVTTRWKKPGVPFDVVTVKKTGMTSGSEIQVIVSGK